MHAILFVVDRQKPPNHVGKLTGFPYGDLWEEYGEPWERLWDHGYDRDLIDRYFRMARRLGQTDLSLTKAQIRRTIAPLRLRPSAHKKLTEKLYYLAGHYYSPRFHKLAGDAPSDVRRMLKRVASTATKLENLMSKVTHAAWRQVGAARLNMHSERRGRPDISWPDLQDQIADLASSAQTIADEFPRAGRGTTEKVLLGRWLRQSAEALEEATGRTIQTKVSDSAGPNFRFEGADGAVFQSYCSIVDESIATKTLVQAVRSYERHGFAGPPS